MDFFRRTFVFGIRAAPHFFVAPLLASGRARSLLLHHWASEHRSRRNSAAKRIVPTSHIFCYHVVSAVTIRQGMKTTESFHNPPLWHKRNPLFSTQQRCRRETTRSDASPEHNPKQTTLSLFESAGPCLSGATRLCE